MWWIMRGRDVVTNDREPTTHPSSLSLPVPDHIGLRMMKKGGPAIICDASCLWSTKSFGLSVGGLKHGHPSSQEICLVFRENGDSL